MATSSSELKNIELFRALQKSPDYRDFLRVYLDKRSLSFSAFARSCGFGRGFPAEVIAGKRRLTSKSARSFEKALVLPKAGKKFFRLLVSLEEPDAYLEIERSGLKSEISVLRSTPWKQERRDLNELTSPSLKNILADSRAMVIYAAAGEPENGASREDIEVRTKLFGKELDLNLRNLEAVGLLRIQEGRYFPKDSHLFLETHDRSDLLKQVFQKACRSAGQRVTEADLTSEMFFVSNFCINEEALPELKKALRETILKFVDDSLNTSGDRVVKLITGLHL